MSRSGPETVKQEELDRILKSLIEIIKGDYRHPLTVSDEESMLDAVHLAINMTAEELGYQAEQQQKHQERITHLNQVLLAIRDVNHIIVWEKDRERIIEKICEALVKNRSYPRASIVLVDRAMQPQARARFSLSAAHECEAGIPKCMSTALEAPGLVIISNPLEECPDCPMSRKAWCVGAMAIRLEYQDRVFGVLAVASAAGGIADEEEHDLLSEVAQDVGMALHNLEQQEQRKEAEKQLHEVEARYRTLFHRSLEMVFVHDFAGQFVDVNERGLSLLGYDREEIKDIEFPVLLDEEDLPRAMEAMKKIYEQGFEDNINEYRVRTKDGKHIWIEVTGARLDRDGEPMGVIGLARDITQRKKLERQLNSAQRMEAVGRLAGGIAHDFNNMLTVITSYSGFLLELFQQGDPSREDVQEILRAANRATKLTQQLLAFGRRQAAQPTVLDLNEVMREMDRMLQRLITEDIELRTLFEEELGAVKADRGQLEQVIMNLVINARDAMPHGGKLTVQTANVVLDAHYFQDKAVDNPPGPYVMLSVSDTGTGMDAHIKEHIFEPFFTTKAEGQGTGLGLATIYGIVKQNEGCVWVYSEIGVGTTFKVYLPRIETVRTIEAAPSSKQAALAGEETILLVEDERAVRMVAGRILSRAGYGILEAESAIDALSLIEQHDGPIDLMLTDVIMPKMSGRELADRLKVLRPDIKVLFMSGYTNDVIAHHGVLDEGTAFIEKPFTRDALLGKVRTTLDESG